MKRHTKRYPIPTVGQVWRRAVMMSRKDWGDWEIEYNTEYTHLLAFSV